MPNINLVPLLHHNAAVAPYPNNLLYVDAAPQTKLTPISASTAYESADSKYSKETFGGQMNRLADNGVHEIQSPKTFGTATVFHVSQKDKNDDRKSASIFFRIYAIASALFPYAGGTKIPAYEIVYLNHQGEGVRVTMRLDNGTRKEGLDLDGMNMTVTNQENRYNLIYEIVGIGYHIGPKSYQLLVRNNQIFSGANITL